MVDGFLIATSGGLEDPFLELEDRPFALRPGSGLPFIYRPRDRSHDVLTPTHRASVPFIGPTSAYPGHYPWHWLLGPSSPRLACGRPLLLGSTAEESWSWVPPFLMSALWSRRTILSTGFRGSEYWSGQTLPAPSLSRFGQADNPRWLGMGNDGSTYLCLRCP